MRYDVIVIGGGPAGLAAALAAWEKGAKQVLILERDRELGGILNQCIHNGFGLHYFKEELTGPEYAARFIKQIEQTGIQIQLDTMVLEVTQDKQVRCVSAKRGYQELEANAIVLAMGCRERTRGAIAIPGDRGAGVFTAGTAQRYVNIEGYTVGKRVVILGSGDIGLIMARRLTLEGARVLACIEICPYSNGLTRNIVQCLEDYEIPLYLSHTITDIKGKERISEVTISKVDSNNRPIPGTEINLPCDTLLLSVGLIPENELTRQAEIPTDCRTNGIIVHENMETLAPGIFACGNVVHVHDLVDYVSEESSRAGASAASSDTDNPAVEIVNGEHVTYTVPQRIRTQNVEKSVDILFRTNAVLKDQEIRVSDGRATICAFKRERMTPGEMEKITLSQKALQQIQGDKLVISVHSREGGIND